jgi:hypothetical protein
VVAVIVEEPVLVAVLEVSVTELRLVVSEVLVAVVVEEPVVVRMPMQMNCTER